MAYTQTDNFGDIWEMSGQDAERLIKKALDDKLTIYEQHVSNLFKRFKKGPPTAHPSPRWGEQETYPRELTGTLSGSGTTLTITSNLFNASPTRANLLRCVNATNTILRYQTGGTVSIAKVTAIHATDPVLTVEAYANTSMPADGASQEWTIVGEPYKDSRDADTPRMIDRTTRFTTSQIISRTFEILDSRQALAMEWIPNETEHQIDALIQSMYEEIWSSAIQMWPAYSGGAYVGALNVEESTMMGLDWWAENLFGSGGDYENSSILVDKGGEALDKDHLDSLTYAMLKNHTNFNTGDWVIAVHPYIRQYMHDFDISYREVSQSSTTAGFMVDKVALKCGKVMEIVADFYIPKDTCYVTDCGAWQHRWYKNDEIHRKELPSAGRYRRWQISGQKVGLQGRRVKESIGKLKNLATE